MKKAKPSRSNGLRREYKRSDFPKGLVRGKYAARASGGACAPDAADAAPLYIGCFNTLTTCGSMFSLSPRMEY